MLEQNKLTSPELTGDWEKRLETSSAARTRSTAKFMLGHRPVTTETVAELDKLARGVQIERANLGPCPICGRPVIENRRGYSSWSKEDPGCGFVIWKRGRQVAAPEVARRS